MTTEPPEPHVPASSTARRTSLPVLLGMLAGAVLIASGVLTHRWWYEPTDNSPDAVSKRNSVVRVLMRDTRVGLLSVQRCVCRVHHDSECVDEDCTGYTMSEADYPASYVGAGYATLARAWPPPRPCSACSAGRWRGVLSRTGSPGRRLVCAA